MLVPISRAPARTAADATAKRSKSNSRCNPTTTASKPTGLTLRSLSDDIGPSLLERLDDAGAAATSTRSPGCTSSAAAIAELTTSPTAGIPIAASAASCWARTAIELLVTKITRRPDARNRAIASTDPAMGS